MTYKVSQLAQKTDHNLPWLFLAIALPMILFFALAIPPFQAPDEYSHLFRADEISFGEFIGTRPDDRSSGGHVEISFIKLAQVFAGRDNAFCIWPESPLPLKTSPDTLEAARALPINHQRIFVNCATTVRYGPVLYIPQALALTLSRFIEMKPLSTFYFARIVNGSVAALIGFWALTLATRGRFLMFFILTTPMSLFLIGSLSQDALLISGSALFLAAASKIISENRPPRFRVLLALMFLLVSLAWGRLPCLALGAVFLLKPVTDMRWRETVYCRWLGALFLACAAILTAGWIYAVIPLHIDSLFPTTSVKQQSRFLSEHWNLIPQILIHSMGATLLFIELIGVFGWTTVLLPWFFYKIAFIGFAIALALETKPVFNLKAFDKIIIILACLLGIVTTYLANYLTWIPVGKLSFTDVTARYFIPFILAAPFILPTARNPLGKLLYVLVPFLPSVSIIGAAVSIQTIITHYHESINR